MQKKLIALAVAGLVAAPAFAATSNVDVGGTINLSVSYLDADTAQNGGNLNVSSNSSNIFFKGAEDLGGGLSAIWQIQTYFSAGGTGNADSGVVGESLPDGLSSGNTFVGLKGGWGTVLLGKHEAPAKLIGRSVDLFGDQIGDNRNLVARSGRGIAALFVDTTGTRVYSGGFDLRPNNVIAYASPNFSGFSGMLAYVTNVGQSAWSDLFTDASGNNIGVTLDDSVNAWSANVKYENGPLMVGLGYQQHNLSNLDEAGLGLSGSLGDENVWRLAAAYTFGNLKLVGLYQKEDDLNQINVATGAIVNNSADRTTWGLGAAYKMGNMTLKGQYYNTGDLANVANTGADMYAIGLDYSLSKRTTAQFAYATTDNESAASYSASGGGHGDNAGTTQGGNPTGFSIGIKHAF